jgi:hypothetical protein
MHFDWIFWHDEERRCAGKPYFMRVSRTRHPVIPLITSMPASTIRAKPLKRFCDLRPRTIEKEKTPCS